MHLKGTGDIPIPHKGYVEANITIPCLPRYNEDVLLLVVLHHNYGERVPVQIGTQVIDHLDVTITEKELQQAGDAWKQVHLNTVISKGNTMKGLNITEYNHEGC